MTGAPVEDDTVTLNFIKEKGFVVVDLHTNMHILVRWTLNVHVRMYCLCILLWDWTRSSLI